MMKKVLLILLALSSLLYTSCDDDDNDISWGNYYMSVGTVTKSVDSLYITTDKGNVLKPLSSHVSTKFLEDNMRVLVDFRILSDADDNESYNYYIDIFDVDEILTKPVFKFDSETPKEVKDSIGNDLVRISDIWSHKDYINVEFVYGGGSKSHYINLVYDAENGTTENGEIILELKHNDNNDPYKHRIWGLASFDVSSFEEEGKDSVDFLIRTMGEDGEYEYNKIITHSFNDNAESNLDTDLRINDKSISTKGFE